MRKNNFNIVLLICFCLLLLTSSCEKHHPEITIINPYENVNWNTWWQYKSSLHVHTTASDGYFSPNQVIDKYKYLDYKVLALSDHNFVTYPWEKISEFEPSETALRFLSEGLITEESLIFKDRNPSHIGMLAVQANEISNHHHLGSYFSDYNSTTSNIHNSLNAIQELDGLSVLFHPIKYQNDLNWYYDLYEQYSNLIGIEVYNRKYDETESFYYEDFFLWDSLLTDFMPHRPIWGFANDDFHTVELGYAYNMFLMPEFSIRWVRKSMERGSFYFVSALAGHNCNQRPKIKSINVNNAKATIKISASNYYEIKWISNGEIIHKGNTIDLSENKNATNHVRAMIYNKDKTAFAGTQAFGILRK